MEPGVAPFAVVVLMGLPGSGKSMLARALHEATGLAVVDRDAIRAAMFHQHLKDVDEKSASTAAVWLALRALLEARQGAIIDGMTFASTGYRETARGLAAAFGASHLQVLVKVSQRLAMQRVREQAHTSKERTPRLVRQVAARFAPVERDSVIVDGTRAPDVVRDEVLAALQHSTRQHYLVR